MEMLELLVKLASFGTAGVCVLAVFYISYSIQQLPNDAPVWKPFFMKKYISTCIIIAVICMASGGLNAYFNQKRVDDTNAKWSDAYGNEMNRVEAQKTELNSTLHSLRQQVSQVHNLPPSVSSQINATEMRVQQFRLTPRDQIVREIQATGPRR